MNGNVTAPVPGAPQAAPAPQPTLRTPSASGPPLGPQPKELPLHAAEQTPQPATPNVKFDTQADKRLSEQAWTELSNDLYQAWNASLAARGPLMENLREWSDAYDLITEEKDFPFVDSSNIKLPFMPAQLESLCAYIAGAVIVPRMYIVQGNTQAAAQNAATVERFYNTELLRLRSDGSSYFARLVDWLHMSLRDGTCVMENLWNRQRRRKLSTSWVPKMDPTTGFPMIQDGMPVWEERHEEVDVYVKDYAEWTPISLKEFGLIPSEATSIESAVGCWKVDWLYEDQLDRYVRAGIMDSGEVEAALRYDETGTSDVSADRTGVYDKNASQQIAIGLAQGSMSGRFFKNRGPLQAIRVHTRQHDMNGDGVPEENIFWFHALSQRMLGWMPYDYATGQRPFFSFSPFPRPDRFYGYSLPERLAGVASEMDAGHNARNDQIAFRLSPPMAIKEGSTLLDQQGIWYPGAHIEMEDNSEANPTLRLMEQPDIPLSSWQEESLLKQYGNEYTGLNAPATGAQGAGRRSATELKQQAQGTGVRLALINMRFRVSCQQLINNTHALNKQYMKTDPQMVVDQQVFTIPLDVMSQDYTIGIAGMSDPLDSSTRKNEIMSLFQLVAEKVPYIAQNPLRMWYWMRKLCEAFGFSDIYQLIGTEDDAKQAMVQMQQQAAAQAQQQHMQAMTGQTPPGQKPQPRAA